MKHKLYRSTILFLISAMILGCGSVKNTFAGKWTTNIGKVSFTQNGQQVIGAIHGYGGNVDEAFSGAINDSGEAVFSTTWFGDFALVLNGNNFRSKSSELSFCGIRSDNSEELPSGCGFSGKWIVPAKSVFLPGSYMLLKQVAENVTGDLYDGNDKIYDSFSGTVDWGKGWRANGASEQRGELSLWMNASESGFEFVSGAGPNQQQLCAVREGFPNAYLGFFTCSP